MTVMAIVAVMTVMTVMAVMAVKAVVAVETVVEAVCAKEEAVGTKEAKPWILLILCLKLRQIAGLKRGHAQVLQIVSKFLHEANLHVFICLPQGSHRMWALHLFNDKV